MICLDTNICIELLRRESGPLRERLRTERRTGVIAISVLVLFELRYGIAKSSKPVESTVRLDAFLRLPVQILLFEERDATVAASIRAYLEQRGEPIGPFDTLIAAQALARDARLVTRNLREFTRVTDLSVEDWSS